MASTTGFFSNLEGSLETFAAGGAAPTALTAPIMLDLVTTTSTNATPGTICSDANYAKQNANIGSASNATTAGAGAAGYVSRASTAQISFFGAGAAAQQILAGVITRDSAGTPVNDQYQNFASTVTVPLGATYVIASGSLSSSVS